MSENAKYRWDYLTWTPTVLDPVLDTHRPQTIVYMLYLESYFSSATAPLRLEAFTFALFSPKAFNLIGFCKTSSHLDTIVILHFTILPLPMLGGRDEQNVLNY